MKKILQKTSIMAVILSLSLSAMENAEDVSVISDQMKMVTKVHCAIKYIKHGMVVQQPVSAKNIDHWKHHLGWLKEVFADTKKEYDTLNAAVFGAHCFKKFLKAHGFSKGSDKSSDLEILYNTTKTNKVAMMKRQQKISPLLRLSDSIVDLEEIIKSSEMKVKKEEKHKH